MTLPTLTYQHGYLTDCDDTTGFSATHSADPLTGVTLTSDGDIFTITGTADSAVNSEWVAYSDDIPNISTDTYTHWVCRWKTSASSSGLGAKVKLDFGGGQLQTLIGDPNPEYSTGWTVSSGTITSGKTIDKVELWADDYPDSVADGPHSVYYDFLMLCKGNFTFPSFRDLELILENKYADIDVPGRTTDITQFLGMKSPTLRLMGDMDTGTGWHEGVGLDGEPLYMVFRQAQNDPFQWFTSDLIDCKVTPRRFNIGQRADSKCQRVWTCDLKMYSLSDATTTDWGTIPWYGK